MEKIEMNGITLWDKDCNILVSITTRNATLDRIEKELSIDDLLKDGFKLVAVVDNGFISDKDYKDSDKCIALSSSSLITKNYKDFFLYNN